MSRHYNNLPPQHSNNEHNGSERQPLLSTRAKKIGAGILATGALLFGGKEVYDNYYVQPETGITNVEADNQGGQYREMVANILEAQTVPYSFDESKFAMRNVTEERREVDPTIGENETIYYFDNDKEIVDELYEETGATQTSIEIRYDMDNNTASLSLISDYEKWESETGPADEATITTTYALNADAESEQLDPFFDEANYPELNADMVEAQLQLLTVERLTKVTIDSDRTTGSFTYDGENSEAVPLDGQEFTLDEAAVADYAGLIARTSTY